MSRLATRFRATRRCTSLARLRHLTTQRRVDVGDVTWIALIGHRHARLEPAGGQKTDLLRDGAGELEFGERTLELGERKLAAEVTVTHVILGFGVSKH